MPRLLQCCVFLVGHPARFTVTSSQLERPPVTVRVEGPAEVRQSQREVERGIEVEYITTLEGAYVVNILYDGEVHIPGSPFYATFTSTSHHLHLEYLMSRGIVLH